MILRHAAPPEFRCTSAWMHQKIMKMSKKRKKTDAGRENFNFETSRTARKMYERLDTPENHENVKKMKKPDAGRENFNFVKI